MEPIVKNESRFTPAPKIAYRSIGGKVAVVKPRESRFITLNETGSLVWNNLDKGDASFLASAVSAEFNVSFEIALRDVKTFLHKLLIHELIVPPLEP